MNSPHKNAVTMTCLAILTILCQPVWAADDSFSFKKLLMPGPVIEGHAQYEQACHKCHEDEEGVTQTGLCLDCHEDVADDIQKLKGFHGRTPESKTRQCRDCHTDHIGRQGDIVNLDKDRFKHSQTDFELDGKHKGLLCASCHLPDKKFREAPTQCYACHKKNDQHKGAFGEDCQDCHKTDGWEKNSFDHDETQFPLHGKHQKTQCNACHPDEKYVDTPTACFSCHAINDVHNNINGQQCDKCHNETEWAEISFDHNIDTDFALKGEHSKLACHNCHQQSGFEKKLKTGCIDCHKNNDVHHGRNGSQCDSCHTEKSWSNITFDHQRDTDFELRGAHSELVCESCHRAGTTDVETGSVCIDCHREDDVHQTQQGKQCGNCHNETDWRDQVRFNHDLTPFPLVGMHAVSNCESCHSSKSFNDTQTDCADCHQGDDFHDLALGKNCGSCHNPNDWQLWLFDHDKQTDFQLSGAHKNLNCQSCHTEPTQGEVEQSQMCGTCHLNDDVHNRRFGRNCDRCHTTDSFNEIRMQ